MWGSATNEVTTVEVEFVDGTVVTARPGDLSDSFDKRFWIAATAVATSLTTDPSVAAVRAYDSNGSLLAAEVPTPRG